MFITVHLDVALARQVPVVHGVTMSCFGPCDAAPGSQWRMSRSTARTSAMVEDFGGSATKQESWEDEKAGKIEILGQSTGWVEANPLVLDGMG